MSCMYTTYVALCIHNITIHYITNYLASSFRVILVLSLHTSQDLGLHWLCWLCSCCQWSKGLGTGSNTPWSNEFCRFLSLPFVIFWLQFQDVSSHFKSHLFINCGIRCQEGRLARHGFSYSLAGRKTLWPSIAPNVAYYVDLWAVTVGCQAFCTLDDGLENPDLWWRQLCGICRCPAFHLWSTQTPYIKSVCLCSNSLCFAFFIFKHLQASSNSSTLGVHTSADASAGASTDACAGAPVASEGSAGSAGWAGAASEAPEAPGTSVGELGELFWELVSKEF